MTLINTFLIADDDSDDTALLCEALHAIDASIVCHTAENGQGALDILLNENRVRPQLIFLDINMPLMNGWQCLEKIKQQKTLQDIPVIMYSTSSNRKDVEKAFALGAFCFFTKPDQYKILKSILSVIVNTPVKNLPHTNIGPGITFNGVAADK